MNATLIETREIVKRFGGFTALSGVNVTIAQGERLGVIGPNGSGKSTLMNTLMGTVTPTSGSIMFDGRDISRLQPHERARLGLARSYQIPRPFGTMSVRENILVALDFCARDSGSSEQADEIVEEYGLHSASAALASSLNQIQLRRLELARAAATKPRVLISDESMAGLSHGEIDEVLLILNRLSEKGVTIIMIEHIMKAVMRFSNRVICLDAGKIIADGSPQTIVRDPGVRRVYFGA